MLRLTNSVGLTLALSAFLISGAPAQGVDWQYPAVKGAGPVVPIPDTSARPEGDLAYKVVFDVTQDRPGDGRVSPGLASVARFVNLLAISGMDPRQAEIVAVLHASATPAVIRSEHYARRFGTPNPNAELIRQLEENGVEVVVCGQALAGAGFGIQEVMEPVDVSISAMTELAQRQLQGYAVMP